MASSNKINIVIQATDKASGPLKQLKGEIDNTSTAGSKFKAAFGAVAKTSAVVTAAASAAAGKFVLWNGAMRALNIQDAQAKLRGLGHDTKSVQTIMDNALASVKGTSFGLDAAATTAANAVASGIKPGKQLEQVLKTVANASAIAGRDMGSMGAIFNKVAAANKVQMDTINQLHDAGVPALALLSKTIGKTAEETAEMASKGKIDFATFERAMRDGVGKAALEMGNTVRGSWANLQAAMARVGANIVEGQVPRLTTALQSVTTWFDANGPKIANAAKNTMGAIELLLTGDFKRGMFDPSIHEDGKLVDFLFTVREEALETAKAVGDYLAPKFAALWSSLSEKLLPALHRFGQDVLMNRPGSDGGSQSWEG